MCAACRLLNQYLLDGGVFNVLQAGKGAKGAADFGGLKVLGRCNQSQKSEDKDNFLKISRNTKVLCVIFRILEIKLEVSL